MDRTVLIFRCASREIVEGFGADPYVAHGLVASWSIRPFKTVVGPMSATPLRADAL